MPHPPPLIALVEDDPRVRIALERLLGLSGYAVECFACGEDFMASAPTREPDCLVLDLNLPGMSGLELQERLVAAARSLPTVVITGQDSSAGRARALAAGASAYLCKPIDREDLMHAIDHAIDTRAATALTEEKRP